MRSSAIETCDLSTDLPMHINRANLTKRLGLLIAGLAAVAFAGYALGLTRAAGTGIALLASVLIGFEASSLRRWTLARRGFALRDAVVARDSAEAEARLLARWLDPASLPPPPRPPFPGGPVRRAEPVIGLFPAREGGR